MGSGHFFVACRVSDFARGLGMAKRPNPNQKGNPNQKRHPKKGQLLKTNGDTQERATNGVHTQNQKGHPKKGRLPNIEPWEHPKLGGTMRTPKIMAKHVETPESNSQLFEITLKLREAIRWVSSTFFLNFL